MKLVVSLLDSQTNMSEGGFFGGSFNRPPSIVSMISRENRNSKVTDTDTASSKEEHHTMIVSEK
jgi:hypothetical protein